MVLFSMYIFNRYGDNIYYKQWRRTRSVQEGEAGLVAGFIYTLQHISSQLSPSGEGGVFAMRTPLYKLHYYETLTGYRVALLTDTETSTQLVQEVLKEMFVGVFTNTVTKNPSYTHAQGMMIPDMDFDEGLEKLLRDRKLLA